MKGGAGRGQGRKPTLTEDECLEVGARCEGMWRDEIQARLDAKIADAFDIVDEEWNILHAVPPERRAAWLKTEEAEILFADIEIARRERLGISDDAPLPSFTRISVPRPKGLRPVIIAKVAEAESRERGKDISGRFVERCWKDFRRVAKQISDGTF